MALQVYRNNVIELFVAESPEDAVAVAREYYEEAFSGDPTERELALVVEPDDKPLTLNYGDAEPGEARITHTAGEWAQIAGRGFLATTEW